MACGPANDNDAEFWNPSAGDPTIASDDAGDPVLDDSGTPIDTGVKPSDGGTVAPGKCLHADFTTKTYFGRYAPSHVLAVWVTDARGAFVKTVGEWGKSRSSNLAVWRSVSKASTVDAVTGATLKSHGPVSVDWNCANLSGGRVPNGDYVLHVEFAESNAKSVSAAGPQLAVPFKVGAAGTFTAPDAANYVSTKVVITP
ncbi:MAG: DUF2271 domain-containing protein [Myxococcales bacterium]|nr:DUF2271 domain-containing protein [Myxococcales bacterium]